MPSLIDTRARTQAVLMGANKLLAERGLGGLTLRAIAAEVRISLGSLTSHYDSRERLLHLLVQLAGQSWLSGLRERTLREGVSAFLPAAEEDIDDTRVWLSWTELGRSTPELRGTIENLWLEERALLSQATEHQLDEGALDTALAVVRGLREAICAGDRPMTLDRAKTLLTDHVETALHRQAEAASALARSSATIRSGSSAE